MSYFQQEENILFLGDKNIYFLGIHCFDKTSLNIFSEVRLENILFWKLQIREYKCTCMKYSHPWEGNAKINT